MPSGPSSTPKPDCFQPPMGAYMSMAERPWAFTNTVPAERRDATSAASASSLLQTDAHSPKGVSLAALDRLVEVVVGEHRQGRGELLVAHDAAVGGGAITRAGETRYPPDPASSPRIRPGRSTRAPAAAASATIASTRSRAAPVCTGPMVTPSANPSPTTSAASRAARASTVSVQPVPVHVEPLDGHADLPAGDEGRLHDPVGQGGVDGHVGGQDGGVVAAELEHDRPGRDGGGRHDRLAGGDAAGEGDHVDVGVGHEGGAEGGAGTVDHVQDAGRQRLGHGRGHQQHGAGAGGRRLDHDRVAGQQRRQHLVAHDRDGPVEGQDGGHDAVGHPLDARRPTAEVRAARASATRGAKAAAMPPMVAVSKIASRGPCRARG